MKKSLLLAAPLLLTQVAMSLPALAGGLDSAAARVCKQYYYVSDKESCMRDLMGLRFDRTAVKVCNQYYYVSDKQSCLKDLAGMHFDSDIADICQQYYYVSDKQSCLKRSGN